MFTVEMLPAYQGDALWVEYGNADKPNRFLIDGGLVGTVNHIIEKIHAVAEKEGRCRLELLVLSHVDADHIEGLIKLLGTADLPLDIGDLWFNGWRHLPKPEDDSDGFLGAKQGEFLAALIRERELPWNEAFEGDTIYVPDDGELPRHTLPGGMELILMSPTFGELLRMSKRWEKELDEAGLLEASHEEILAELMASRQLAPDVEFLSDEPIDIEELTSLRQRKDHSPANGSSIGFLGRYDGKSCLFSGDAYWQVLSETAQRLAEEERGQRVQVDAFKIPHHGSRNNMSDELLARLDCQRFLVSTNGNRFRHPDREAIARLVGGTWRPDPAGSKPVQVEFNYRTKFNEEWNARELRDTWNYGATYPGDGEEGLLVKL